MSARATAAGRDGAPQIVALDFKPDPEKLARWADLGVTERQLEVLGLMMQGKSNKAISHMLNMAEPTVKNHITAILKALKVTNRTEAVIKVGRMGWNLSPDI